MDIVDPSSAVGAMFPKGVVVSIHEQFVIASVCYLEPGETVRLRA